MMYCSLENTIHTSTGPLLRYPSDHEAHRCCHLISRLLFAGPFPPPPPVDVVTDGATDDKLPSSLHPLPESYGQAFTPPPTPQPAPSQTAADKREGGCRSCCQQSACKKRQGEGVDERKSNTKRRSTVLPHPSKHTYNINSHHHHPHTATTASLQHHKQQQQQQCRRQW